MKHQREILGQRIENMRNGIIRAENNIDAIEHKVSNILNLVKNDNSVDNLVIEIKSDLDELKDFLTWVKEQ